MATASYLSMVQRELALDIVNGVVAAKADVEAIMNVQTWLEDATRSSPMKFDDKLLARLPEGHVDELGHAEPEELDKAIDDLYRAATKLEAVQRMLVEARQKGGA